MSIVGNSYLIPLIKGKSDLLRIPQELVNDLGISDTVVTTATKPNGRNETVRINPMDRTLLGLCAWLRTCDDENIRSVLLTVLSERPYTFSVKFSEQTPELAGDKENIKIHRPDEGLYLGGKLLSQFYELIGTNEPIAINEFDLLRHVFICGSTGSGKTVLSKVIIEEAALKGIPVIAVDLEGDISSMAILPSSEDPSELVPWVTAWKDESKEARAAILAGEHKTKLQHWGFSDRDVNEFKKKVAVNVFTPCSNAGFRLALSAFAEPTEDLGKLEERDSDVIQFMDQMAQTFVSRLNLTRRQADKAKGYIYEIIRTFWDRGISLRGHEGIKRVIDEVMTGEAGIEEIGGKATSDYISGKDRENISNAINTILTGSQKLWFEGFPLDIAQLINKNHYDGKTPITIINVKHLGFGDRAYVIGHIAYLICSWMRGRGGIDSGIDKPRLVFYIDEIGGSGSKEAFFPPVAISPSKPALNLLLRLGRGYGVCCMFATQSPGDIDYKAMSQCGTWVVGQLGKQRERKKIEEGVGIAGFDFDSVAQYMPNFEAGQFLLKTPTPPLTIFNARWVMHPVHRRLSKEYLERLKERYEKEVRILFEDAEEYVKSRNPSTARNILESIISGYRFSALCPRAYLLLGKVLYDMSDYDNAIKKLTDMLNNRMEAEESGEAYFLIGKCKEQQGSFDEAAIDFAKVDDSAANEETKSIAFNHEQYCKSRTTWAELTEIQKFFWWVIGRKPDDTALIRLQSKDKELFEKRFTTKLREQDFSIPEPIDFSQLIEATKKAASEQREKTTEQVKAERRAAQQVPKIEAFLHEGDLQDAFSACKRVIQLLQDADAFAPPSVIAVLGKCKRLREEKSEERDKKILSILADAKQFEFEIANLFHLKGYKSLATRFTKDGGVDVRASSDQEKIIIQCKRWKRSVGRAAVDELAGVWNRNDVQRAILATTSTFTDDARQAAYENHIELWDFYRIRREWQEALMNK